MSFSFFIIIILFIKEVISVVTIKEVKTKKEIKEFVNFPLNLYKGSPYFVPELYGEEIALFKIIA